MAATTVLNARKSTVGEAALCQEQNDRNWLQNLTSFYRRDCRIDAGIGHKSVGQVVERRAGQTYNCGKESAVI